MTDKKLASPAASSKTERSTTEHSKPESQCAKRPGTLYFSLTTTRDPAILELRVSSNGDPSGKPPIMVPLEHLAATLALFLRSMRAEVVV